MDVPTLRNAALLRIASLLLLLSLAPSAYAQRGSDSSVGYIDPAVPMDVFRFRFDNVLGINRPDRAEFFWPKQNGPAHAESNVNYTDLAGYLEVKLANRVSVFAEAPMRFLDPEQNADHNGVGDTTAGIKGALISTPTQVLTFEFKSFIPTGKTSWGLGTGHVTLEPGLLYYQQLTDRVRLEAQLTDWIPVSTSDFSGNIVSYGSGLSYQIAQGENYRIRPVMELVGWSVLGGKETVLNGTPKGLMVSAAGDNIANAKMGVRIAFGSTQVSDPGPDAARTFVPNSDLYLGFGQSLTPDVWYNEIFRVEFRIFF